MGQDLSTIERMYDAVAKEYAETFTGEHEKYPLTRRYSDFIYRCLKNTGFEKIELIEREPYPEVEYQSRRAYVFAKKVT